MWSQLSVEEKEIFTIKAAKEREHVAKQIEELKHAIGGDLSKLPGAAKINNSTTANSTDPNQLIFKVGRIRHICRLDPDVKNISKEAITLVTKCAELVTTKLGIECVRVAQVQNRRSLLPDDVAQVCSTREQFLFLKDDVKDFVQDQIKQKQPAADKQNNSNNKKPSAAAVAASSNSKPLTSYFTKLS